MTRRILLLAYHFPPVGGAGAMRNTKLARLLPELGCELTVVTGPQGDGHRWAPLDDELAREVDARVNVVRVDGPEPPWSSGGRRRAERWLRLEWPWQRWWTEQVVPRAVEHGRDADLVYSSLAPFATAEAAIAVARELGKPLVFDLEDPWALDEMMAYETALHRRLELRLMRRTLAAADGIVMNTPESKRRLLEAFPELRSKPVTSIVNGFDDEDFAGAPPARTDAAFRIVHTGTLHTGAAERRGTLRRLLGGATNDVHVRSRSLVYLLQAVEQLAAEEPDLASRLEIHLAGRLTPADRDALGDAPWIREHGFLPHPQTVALIRSADLLFLPMHDLPPGRPVAIVPCKTYEYLASGRPILAAVPDGDARDLLERAGSARITRPTDVAAMKRTIVETMADRAVRSPDASLLGELERRSLTAQVLAFCELVWQQRNAHAEGVGARYLLSSAG